VLSQSFHTCFLTSYNEKTYRNSEIEEANNHEMLREVPCLGQVADCGNRRINGCCSSKQVRGDVRSHADIYSLTTKVHLPFEPRLYRDPMSL
jgi:hypothetical protein